MSTLDDHITRALEAGRADAPTPLPAQPMPAELLTQQPWEQTMQPKATYTHLTPGLIAEFDRATNKYMLEFMADMLQYMRTRTEREAAWDSANTVSAGSIGGVSAQVRRLGELQRTYDGEWFYAAPMPSLGELQRAYDSAADEMRRTGVDHRFIEKILGVRP